MRVRELLPIGSVIVLKDGEQPLMIYGIKQTTGGGLFKKEEVFDYICVLYPQGNIGPDEGILVNHESIDKILFRGYEDEARKEFLDEISKQLGEE